MVGGGVLIVVYSWPLSTGRGTGGIPPALLLPASCDCRFLLAASPLFTGSIRVEKVERFSDLLLLLLRQLELLRLCASAFGCSRLLGIGGNNGRSVVGE